MTHETVRHVFVEPKKLFDSADFESARKPNGNFSLGRSLRVMRVSEVTVARLVGRGLIDGEDFDKWNGLSLRQLIRLSLRIDELKDKGEIIVRKSKRGT